MSTRLSGLTLIELLVVVSLIAALTSMALAYFPDLVRAYQADAVVQRLRAAINLARHAAIMRNRDVVVCPRRGTRCGPHNTWREGMLIFEDHDRDRRFGNRDVVVAQLPAERTGRIDWRAFRNRSYLVFTARGMTDWQNGHLQYCPDDNDPRNARQLVLNYAGRTYASADRDGDGIHEDAHGEALACS